MSNTQFWKVAALSLGLSACATGVDVRAPNGMVPYETEGEEASLVSAQEVSAVTAPATRVSRQQTVHLAQTSCVQTQPHWQR